MRYRFALLVAMGCVLGLPLIAAGQPTVDLSIASLSYQVVSPGMVSLEAVVQVASVEAGDPFLTEIRFFLDGSVAGSAPFLVEVRPPSTCLASVPPNCGGSCPSIVIDGDTVAGICVLYEEDCYCIYLQSFNVSPVPMQEGAQLTGIVDPDNVVEETDENNNMFSGPVAAAITTWGTMKALYQ